MLGLRLADGTPVAARIFDPASVPPAVGDEVALHVRGTARAFPPTGRSGHAARPTTTDDAHP